MIPSYPTESERPLLYSKPWLYLHNSCNHHCTHWAIVSILLLLNKTSKIILLPRQNHVPKRKFKDNNCKNLTFLELINVFIESPTTPNRILNFILLIFWNPFLKLAHKYSLHVRTHFLYATILHLILITQLSKNDIHFYLDGTFVAWLLK